MNKQASCATCGTTKQLLRCAKCKTVYYCSTAHQHIDWLTHKQECRKLARQKNNGKQQQQLQQAVVSASLGKTAMTSIVNAKVEYPPAADNNWNDIERNVSKRTEPPSCCNHCIGATTCSIPNNTKPLEAINNFTVISCNDQQQRQLLQRKSNTKLPLQNSHVVDVHLPLISHQHPLNRHNICNNQSERNSSYLISRGDYSITGNINERRYEELCRNIINDMNQYGLSVVDDFLGVEKGLQILHEVHHMYSAGEFKDGQLVSNLIAEQDLRTIRGDKITWVKGLEPECSNVGYLINQIDAVVFRANTMANNGKLGNYHIRERTKAMVACYPGSGSHYVMHVDNPNRDGRVITAIYYLNVNWDTKRSGGVLRIFPEHGGSVADIEPKFDRLILFWSDKRNPHEVQPAHRTRYAITVWYFDANEREAALNRCRQYKNNVNKVAVNQTANANDNTTDICT